MKKLLLSIFTILSFSGLIFAQNGDTIPNGGFEYWESGTTYDSPFFYDTPNEDLSALGNEPVTKATMAADVHSGTAAVRMETINTLFGPVPGIIVLGDAVLSTETITPDYEFSHRPDSLTAWYKYSPSGQDTAQLIGYFTKWNQSNNERDTIGIAYWETSMAASSYTRLSTPVQWFSTDNPDTLMILGFSSKFASPSVGSVLFYDDLEFVYLTTGLDQAEAEKIEVYPNPVQDELTVNVNQDDAEFILYDIIGKKVMQNPIEQGRNKIHLGTLPAGTYIYKIQDKQKQSLDVGKLLVK